MKTVSDRAEEIVRAALINHYPAFSATPNNQLVTDIVAILNDPSKNHVEHGSSFESDAVFQIRRLLLETFSYGVVSVKTVVCLFSKLNRADELGWLAG